MNLKTEAETSRLDTAKLAIAVLLLASGVLGFYYYADYPLFMRVLGLLAVAGVAVAVAVQTELGRGLWHFALESRNEVRKVVWPTRTETTQTTLVVLGMVILVGIFLWLLDMFLLWAVRLLTG
jgi:preprotein translocase subunit SecE